MKELDLMYALDAADNKMLLDAENFEIHPRRRLLNRIALIAAVVALLSVSVYAVYSETRITYPNEENSVFYQDLVVDGITYSHVEIEYDLQPVVIKDTAVRFLQDMINMVQGRWAIEGNKLIGCNGDISHSFESLKHTENFFGLTFELPEIIRNGQVGTKKVKMSAIPEYYPEGLPPENSWGYEPDLGSAELYFSVVDPADHIDDVYVQVYIGLTETYTSIPATGGWFSPLDLLGDPVIRETQLDDEEFTFLTYTDDPDNDIDVFYVRNGIGYCLCFHTAEDFTGDPVKLVRPYLKNLG